MRAILLILIVAVVAIIAAVGTGLIDITQTRGAKVPDVDASRSGVSAQGGQTPAFDVETGSVEVGTRKATVPLPTVTVNPAGNDSGSASNSATPSAQ